MGDQNQPQENAQKSQPGPSSAPAAAPGAPEAKEAQLRNQLKELDLKLQKDNRGTEEKNAVEKMLADLNVQNAGDVERQLKDFMQKYMNSMPQDPEIFEKLKDGDFKGALKEAYRSVSELGSGFLKQIAETLRTLFGKDSFFGKIFEMIAGGALAKFYHLKKVLSDSGKTVQGLEELLKPENKSKMGNFIHTIDRHVAAIRMKGHPNYAFEEHIDAVMALTGESTKTITTDELLSYSGKVPPPAPQSVVAQAPAQAANTPAQPQAPVAAPRQSTAIPVQPQAQNQPSTQPAAKSN